jgi:hypothetical protein
MNDWVLFLQFPIETSAWCSRHLRSQSRPWFYETILRNGTLPRPDIDVSTAAAP